eukprot:CAMPEP_0176023300 /NCGR_PEP_ID=MMETSP0120_2-20121206/11364_1 /TAXON_ID=160619 /ORGANISM="Kryptoperidinium foliaceum, Strain CCMP 1326" /LENGTH=525 /DNA_ID=CAMNT_0017356461 /DNA_START=128 /DNA_END=1706 /DNA_ORIENTATION=+
MSDGGGDVEMGDFGGFTTTETTYESYCEKMKQSCVGVGIGFLLFFGSMGLMVWNEGRAVSRRKDLEEGLDIVTSIRLENFNPNTTTSFQDGDLVHVTASLSTPSVLRDDIFGVVTGSEEDGSSEQDVDFGDNSTTPDEVVESALRLQRLVQMYQWRENSRSEKRKTASGGTTTQTTYSYDKVWSSTKYNSEFFHNQDQRLENPSVWPFEYEEWEASKVLLGGKVELSSEVVDRMLWFEPIENVEVSNIPDADLREKVSKQDSSTFYYRYQSSSSPSNPQIGDMIISWEVVNPQTISIVARIEGEQLTTFVTSRGGSLLLLQTGSYTAEEMFQQANDENEQLTWILRFVGFLLMFISILLILQPFSTAMDIIPFIGDCIGDGLETCVFPCIAFTIALPVSVLVISLAWLAYRPAIAVPVLVGCTAIICCIYFRGRSVKPNEDANSPQKPPNSGLPPQQAEVVDEENKDPYSTYPEAQVYGDGNNGNDTKPSFSQALDLPPPIKPPTGEYAEEIAMPAPYVPQVYKP